MEQSKSQSGYSKVFLDVSAYSSSVCVYSVDMVQWGSNPITGDYLMVFVIGAGAIIGLIQAYDSTKR